MTYPMENQKSIWVSEDCKDVNNPRRGKICHEYRSRLISPLQKASKADSRAVNQKAEFTEKHVLLGVRCFHCEKDRKERKKYEESLDCWENGSKTRSTEGMRQKNNTVKSRRSELQSAPAALHSLKLSLLFTHLNQRISNF